MWYVWISFRSYNLSKSHKRNQSLEYVKEKRDYMDYHHHLKQFVLKNKSEIKENAVSIY